MSVCESHVMSVCESHVMSVCESHVMSVCESHVMSDCESHVMSVCESHVMSVCESHVFFCRAYQRLSDGLTKHFLTCLQSALNTPRCWVTFNLNVVECILK